MTLPVFGGVVFTSAGTRYLWGGQANIPDSAPGLQTDLYQFQVSPIVNWVPVTGRIGTDAATAREGAVAFTVGSNTYMWGGWCCDDVEAPYFSNDLFIWNQTNLVWDAAILGAGSAAAAREGAVTFQVGSTTYLWGGYADTNAVKTFYNNTSVKNDLYSWDDVNRKWDVVVSATGGDAPALTGATTFTIPSGTQAGVYLWGGAKVCFSTNDTGCSLVPMGNLGQQVVSQNYLYKWDETTKAWNYYTGSLDTSSMGEARYGCSSTYVALGTGFFGAEYDILMYYGRQGSNINSPMEAGYVLLALPCPCDTDCSTDCPAP